MKLKLKLKRDRNYLNGKSLEESLKIPFKEDNFLDVLNVKVARKMFPFFRTLNLTPNNLTTISGVLSLVSSLNFVQQKFVSSAILFYISYFFDCVDGNYARTYDMYSKFGDKYDHYKDAICHIILYIVYFRYNTLPKKVFITVFLFYVIFFVTMYLHLACIEDYISRKKPEYNSEYLQKLYTKLPKNMHATMNKYIKYLGDGSLMAYTSFIILLNELYKKKKRDNKKIEYNANKSDAIKLSQFLQISK